jgi:tetrahydromethanopterin S-methyltransferase subunit G
MQTMTERSTDERLDRLEEKVDEGFTQVDQRFQEVDQRFAQVDQKLGQIDERFDGMEGEFKAMQREINQRFDGIHHLMFQGIIAICGMIITGFLGVLAFVATQV